MLNRITLGGIALRLMACLALGPAVADAAGLTLSPSVLSLSPGQSFVVTVGIDSVTEVQGYTLDIEFDAAELTFLGATQLGSSEQSAVPGNFEALAFSVDPSAALGQGMPGRASVLVAPDQAGTAQSPRSIVFIDGRTNFPALAPAGLFQLQFQATQDLVLDGADDLRVGLLDVSANDVTSSLRNGGASIPLAPAQVSLTDVPESSAPAMLAWGAILLALLARRSGAVPRAIRAACTTSL
ncbi:MAG: cohesin domain-containing protein [bacterium]